MTLQENQSLNLEYQRNKELRELKEEIKRQENVITNLNDDNEYLTDSINSLEVKNTILNNIIDKAIEYINTFDKGDYISSIKILDILNGSDKE